MLGMRGDGEGCSSLNLLSQLHRFQQLFPILTWAPWAARSGDKKF